MAISSANLAIRQVSIAKESQRAAARQKLLVLELQT